MSGSGLTAQQEALLFSSEQEGDPQQQLSPVFEGSEMHSTAQAIAQDSNSQTSPPHVTRPQDPTPNSRSHFGQGEPYMESHSHAHLEPGMDEGSAPREAGDLESHHYVDAEADSPSAGMEAPEVVLPSRRMRVPVATSLSMLKVPPKIIDRYVNLLVLGESGLGKTTFIKNCFADLSQEPFELRDASGASMQEFRDDPDTFCTRLPPITVPEALIRLHYSVQDVPGYGDDLLYENSDSYIAEVLELIGKQNVRQCLETQGILLDELEFKHMFDCCLYFISPHQLKPVDLKFMAAISAEVPVIPIIAKADCMTSEEREEFRERIINALKNPSLPNYSGPIEIFKFPDEVMVAAEALGLAPPFAIMASNTMEMVEDQLCPVRHYSWGTCMPLMKEHSDAYFFRKTVLEYGFHALRDEKKRRYVYFRDSFQANNSNTSPPLPASSQSAFASPGVQSQPSGTYGGPQRAGSQQPGGGGIMNTNASYASVGSQQSYPQSTHTSPVPNGSSGYNGNPPVPATPRYPDTRTDTSEDPHSSDRQGHVPKKALSRYFQGMRNKDKAGLTTRGSQGDDYN